MRATEKTGRDVRKEGKGKKRTGKEWGKERKGNLCKSEFDIVSYI